MVNSAVPDPAYLVWNDPNWEEISAVEADKIVNETHEDIVILGTHEDDPDEGWASLVREAGVFYVQDNPGYVNEVQLRSAGFEAVEEVIPSTENEPERTAYFSSDGSIQFYFYRRR